MGKSPKTKEVILGVTGSIASYLSCEIINQLRKKGHNVTVLMTREATEFITPLTLQTLSGNEVIKDLFAPPSQWNPLHTSLADKADLVLIAPATANIIGKLANGICDCLLSCVVLATKAKTLIAPAMNERMYEQKVVQENIQRLKSFGYKFIGPIKGHLVCGYEGMGHLARVEDIVSEVQRLLR